MPIMTRSVPRSQPVPEPIINDPSESTTRLFEYRDNYRFHSPSQRIDRDDHLDPHYYYEDAEEEDDEYISDDDCYPETESVLSRMVAIDLIRKLIRVAGLPPYDPDMKASVNPVINPRTTLECNPPGLPIPGFKVPDVPYILPTLPSLPATRSI